MSNSIAEESRVEGLLDKLNERLRVMERRLAEMEARLASPSPPVPATTPAAKKQDERVPDEILMVIAAAVAAFLGKKARIRRVRRMIEPGVNPWSQQGRVSIQASHNVKHWAR